MGVALEQAEDLEQSLWHDACLAASIFALLIREQEFRHAGILIKANAGPVRDLWMKHLTSALQGKVKIRTVPVGVSLERLLGGLDLGGTLATGRPLEVRGLLAEAHHNVLLLPMADIAEPATVSLVASAMDSGDVRIERDGISKVEPARFGLIAFDESEPDDDGVGDALTDRLMLHIDLRSISLRTAQRPVPVVNGRSPEATLSEDMRVQLCQLAASFGLMSMRPAMQIVELAKAHCRIEGRPSVNEDDVAVAIRLGLLHRAKQIPSPPQKDDVPQEPEQSEQPDESDHRKDDADEIETDGKIPEDMQFDAVDAFLPHGLLAQLKSDHHRSSNRAKSGRQGTRTLSAKRGRPLTSRKGELRSGKQLDLIATLRAATPWQKLRRQKSDDQSRIHIRSSDFCLRRYKHRSETSTIFVVDASGSTALNRLAETKGAIELLLGETYARRDHVALISFRGREAEVLLPPTRALVRAKRSLASLPGGGGTPLASGLKAALSLAEDERRKGREPSIVVMTDGSANVDASGAGGRQQAGEDARAVAGGINGSDFATVLVDVGRQPGEAARQLAELMGATYLPMPFASSKKLSDAVRSCA